MSRNEKKTVYPEPGRRVFVGLFPTLAAKRGREYWAGGQEKKSAIVNYSA